MKNIRSYPDGVVVFPPEGVTVIYGPTGSGKTSILMSISHALFGLPSGGKRELFEAYEHPSGKDLLRAGTQEGCVRVLLSVGGRLYLVERRFRRTGEDSFTYTSGLVEEYIIDKESRSIVRVRSHLCATRTELDNKVAEIVGFKERLSQTGGIRTTVYTSALYVPQFNVHEILEYNPEQRRDIVEKAFGLEKYKVARKNLTKLAEKIDGELKRLEGSIQQLQYQLVRIDKDQLNKKLSDLSSKLDSVEIDIKEYTKKIEVFKLEEKEIRKKYEALLEEKNRLEWRLKEYESKRSQLRELEEKMKPKLRELCRLLQCQEEVESGVTAESLHELIRVANDVLNRLKMEETELKERLAKREKELSMLQEQEKQLIEKYARLIGELNAERKKVEALEREFASRKRLVEVGVCPLCKQPIPREHGEKILTELAEGKEELEQKIRILEDEIRKLEFVKREVETTIGEIERDYAETKQASKEISEKVFKLDRLISELNELADQASRYEEALRSFHVEEVREELEKVVCEIENINKSLEQIDAEIVKLEKEIEKLREQKTALLAEVKSITHQLAEVERLEKELDEKNRRRNRLKKIQESISSISRVVDVLEHEITRIVASEFKEEFAKYMRVLMEGQPIEATVTDDFGVVFRVLVDNRAYSTGSLSGGQSIALSLAYRLALNATVRKYSPSLRKSVLILDEPTTGFSVDLVARLKALLEDLSRSGLGQVIVVTHDETLMEVGDCKIKLELDPYKLESRVFYEECSVSGVSFEEYRELIENILRGKMRTSLQNLQAHKN